MPSYKDTQGAVLKIYAAALSVSLAKGKWKLNFKSPIFCSTSRGRDFCGGLKQSKASTDIPSWKDKGRQDYRNIPEDCRLRYCQNENPSGDCHFHAGRVATQRSVATCNRKKWKLTCSDDSKEDLTEYSPGWVFLTQNYSVMIPSVDPR